MPALPSGGGNTTTGNKKGADSSDDDYFEPDEEELEEERQDAAVRLIQGLFRAKRARYIIRELIKANYVKEIDSLTGEPKYRNRRTGHVSRRKPIFLGSDDLETARYFAASDDYDPGKSTIPQFAVVITNQVFESPKIPNIPEQVLADNDALRETLEHPYFSKFQADNCFFVKNASSEVFAASLASVHGQVSATMARLQKEAERRAKALRREREARALERRNSQRQEEEEEEEEKKKKKKKQKQDGGDDVAPNAGPSSDTSRRKSGQGQGENVDHAEEEGREDEEKGEEEEEEEFDPQEGLLFVYVCTHVAVISKGKGVAGTYFVTADTSWKSKDQLAKSAILLETFAASVARIPVRHKVLFLDVAHTKREYAGFKTRHLYPPQNLYDSTAALCGAVVVGSCRIGQTSEIDLDRLRKETAKYWDAVARKQNRGRTKKGKPRAIDSSDTASATSSGRSISGCSSSSSSSSSSGSGNERSTSSSGSDESARSDDDDDDDGSTDEDSASDGSSSSGGSSNSSQSESSGSGGPNSAGRGSGSSRRRRSSGDGNGDGQNQRGVRSGDDSDSSDGGGRKNRDHRAKKREKKRRDKDYRRRRENRAPHSSGSAVSDDNNRNTGGGAAADGGGNARKSATAANLAWPSGGSNSVVKGQQYEEGTTRQCSAVYDRANYEETMSVFGRAVRDALKGQCVENIKIPRVLVVHLYNFILRQFAPYEHPRMSLAEEEEGEALEGAAGGESGGGDDGKREAAARKKKAAALKKAKKEADKAEAKRRAKLGVRAAAEELRQAKEAAALREAEEEKRQRTQLPVVSGLNTSAIARATACASPSPPPRPVHPFPVEVTRTAVRLAWEDPPFPGEPPLSYELEARGDLRGNSTWKPVFPPWYPTILSAPVGIAHRVPGLGLRYRVRACNHGGWGAASNPSEVITTRAWLEDQGKNATAHAMEALARAGGPRLVLARMRRYSASLLVQAGGFHQLVAEFNKGGGIPRASLAKEVAVVVTDAMELFSQNRDIQSSGLLLLGWATRGKGESGGGGFDSYSLPRDLVERCLDLAAKAEKLHSMDVAIKSHAGWAKHYLGRRGRGRWVEEDGTEQAIVEYRATHSEENASAGASTLSDGGGRGGGGGGGGGGGERWQ